DNTQDDNSPQVAEDGINVVWQGYDDTRGARGDLDIFRYHVPSGGITNVSSNAFLDDGAPRITGNRVVWESEHLGGNWEVMHFDLSTEVIPQNVSRNEAAEDRYPVVSDELVVWRAYDGQVYRLMVARQAEPEVTTTLPLVVYGDTKVEPDEMFWVDVTDPSVNTPVVLPSDVVTIDDGTAVVTILNDDSGLDYGDAPPQYPVVFADDGARHGIPEDQSGNPDPQLFLGALIDPESDGQPHVDALGDDNDIFKPVVGDDEDGVTWGRLAPGNFATFDVTVAAPVGTPGYLSAWIDYNGDGAWADYVDANGTAISEQIIDPFGDGGPLTAGVHSFQVLIPGTLDAMTTFARFRLSADPNEVALPIGLAQEGEVEDYRVEIEVGDSLISGFKFNDLDGDGVWDREPAFTGVAPVISPVAPGTGVLMSGFDSDFVFKTNVGPNDDLSAGPFPLGFTFEFYGQAYDQFYINNNGNVTFGLPSQSFPQTAGLPLGVPMIAPFWSDVDTRNSGGSVHLASGISPRGNPFVQVDWASVGYHDRTNVVNTNARNSFALYLEDDPGGDIVAFHYYDHDNNGLVDMGWTTGDRSAGANGFGGDGAEIGFDAGNFNEYFSLARPKSQADLNALNEQYGFRFDPTTGRPLGIEPGLAGLTVYLETDGNPGLDHSVEPWTVTSNDDPLTTNVDETGYYEFTRLFDGPFEVHEIVQPGWIQTAPNGGSTLYLAGGSMDIQAVGGSQVADRQTFLIGDGANTLLFELDNNASLSNPGAVQVPFVSGDTASTIATAIAQAVNGATDPVQFRVIATAITNTVTLTGTTLTFDPDTTLLSTNTSHSDPGGFWDVALRPSEQLQGANFGNYKLPHISISDVMIAEGNVGPTHVDVTVSVTDSFGSPIRVDYATADGVPPNPATVLNNDYLAANGSIIIPPHGTPLSVWTKETITRNGSNDYDYHVSGDSLVFEAHDGNDWEIYLYEGATDTIQQLTNNDTDDKLAHNYKDPATGVINVVWSGVPDRSDPNDPDGGVGPDSFYDADYEIYLYDTASKSYRRLTYNSYDDKAPQVSDTHVVWWGATPTDVDIFLYDIQANVTDNISDNNFPDYDPRLSGPNVVWSGSDGSDTEIYLYRAVPGTGSGVRTQITNNVLADHSTAIDGTNVVWVGNDGTDTEIFVYQFDPATGAGTTYQLSNNAAADIDPQVSGDNVVWQGLVGTNPEIFYSNVSDAAGGVGATNISNSAARDEH
ncbi:MAG: nidogen-like domain-containing protein, partial [Phycisphaerae bacterium]